MINILGWNVGQILLFLIMLLENCMCAQEKWVCRARFKSESLWISPVYCVSSHIASPAHFWSYPHSHRFPPSRGSKVSPSKPGILLPAERPPKIGVDPDKRIKTPEKINSNIYHLMNLLEYKPIELENVVKLHWPRIFNSPLGGGGVEACT